MKELLKEFQPLIGTIKTNKSEICKNKGRKEFQPLIGTIKTEFIISKLGDKDKANELAKKLFNKNRFNPL